MDLVMHKENFKGTRIQFHANFISSCCSLSKYRLAKIPLWLEFTNSIWNLQGSINIFLFCGKQITSMIKLNENYTFILIFFSNIYVDFSSLIISIFFYLYYKYQCSRFLVLSWWYKPIYFGWHACIIAFLTLLRWTLPFDI